MTLRHLYLIIHQKMHKMTLALVQNWSENMKDDTEVTK